MFAHHLAVLDGLEAAVRAKKAKYIRIDGSTPSSQRQDLVNAFQSQDDVRVAVLSVTAAGSGLTLTAAHTVPRQPWSCAARLAGAGRCLTRARCSCSRWSLRSCTGRPECCCKPKTGCTG